MSKNIGSYWLEKAISEVPGCHLLRQMSPQWGSQKLLQGFVSHEHIAYLSVVNLVKNTQWILAI